MLNQTDLHELTDLRRDLHRRPEVSGAEEETARRVVMELEALAPDNLVTGLGGHGVAAVFDGAAPGPTVMFRAELDGLPIEELSEVAWRSEIAGSGHLCGHDGHMTMLLGLGRLLARDRPVSGRVVLLFQPAEEDGSGARAVVADPRFAALKPDWAFAIHNLPGVPLGEVATCAGLINCASQGVELRLSGVTTHAATPEAGVSPAGALAALIPALQALGPGGALDEDFRLVTITHAAMGEATFGISPGSAVLYATLRTGDDGPMEALLADVLRLAEEVAGREGLQLEVARHDVFAASVNDAAAVEVAEGAMASLGIAFGAEGVPMRASEDFGVFGWDARSAMLCLGSGVDHPPLHNPDYDFPDVLIPVGVSLFYRIMRDVLG